MARLFGTDGVRGVANRGPLSPEVVMALGRATIQVLAPRPYERKPLLVVGRDTRLSGSMLEAALVAGVCSAGGDVLSVGVLPTAGVAYLTRVSGAVAGVMISASHNPYMDNGIKLFAAQGTKLEDHLEDAIEAHLQAPAADGAPTGAEVGGVRPAADAARRYLEFLQSTCRCVPPLDLRIGLDCANGAASALAPALFKELGAEVHAWHVSLDGININHQCGALHPEFLQQEVLKKGLDLGFAFDGDADRLIAVDHTGRVLDGDYLLAICAQDLLAHNALSPKVAVSTVMANLGLEHTLQQLGVRLLKTSVGDKYVAQAMRQQGAMLGGEQSGHLIFLNHHTTGDGLLTAIQILNAVRARQASLADLARILHKFPQVLINVRIRERQEPLGLVAVRQAVADAERVLGENGRVLVRLSGTELMARVMIEGPQDTIINPLAQRIAQAVADELGPS